jgi:toxin CcdB
MARFDLYRPKGSDGWLLDVQSDHLYQLPSRMVVPLLPGSAALPAIRDLNPLLEVEGERLAMMTHYMSAMASRDLGRARGSLAAQADEITRALDILLTGF